MLQKEAILSYLIFRIAKYMTTRRSVKEGRRSPLIVGVIASPADLRVAMRMRTPPDLFELRLDHLCGDLDQLENKLSILSAKGRTRRGEPVPLIITARHPREGGANNLPIEKRRELLLRFLPAAKYVDVELRAASSLRSVLDLARRKNVRRIISFHDFDSTPPARSLRTKARAAKSHGADIFKVATRTDTPNQLARLFDFVANKDVDLAISAMGIGKLGYKARRELMQRGSFLNYGHVGRARIAGQPSLSEIRRWALSVGR
jgi:3-dehydroquinate dehydratase-1